MSTSWMHNNGWYVLWHENMTHLLWHTHTHKPMRMFHLCMHPIPLYNLHQSSPNELRKAKTPASLKMKQHLTPLRWTTFFTKSSASPSELWLGVLKHGGCQSCRAQEEEDASSYLWTSQNSPRATSQRPVTLEELDSVSTDKWPGLALTL